MDKARLSKLVKQHATTAKLLGAECVPAYRKSGGGSKKRVTEDPPASAVAAERADAPANAAAAAASIKASGAVIELPSTRKRGDAKTANRLLDELLAKYIADAPHKQFKTDFTNIVFGDGDPCARLMFVGEAPGAEEDRTGKPFCGRSGELLNKMIAAMGLSRETVYIANVLKTRPPDNATPTSFEIDLCAPYLLTQIDIVMPEAIVALGLPASRALLRTDSPMSSMRGRWHEMSLPSGRTVPVMPTYHPAYVLRNYTEDTRKKVWSDLTMAMDKLGIKPASRNA
jgi:DNA polymerase